LNVHHQLLNSFNQESLVTVLQLHPCVKKTWQQESMTFVPFKSEKRY
jgi:hypothetical protein